MLNQRGLVPPSSSHSVFPVCMLVCGCVCIIKCLFVRECLYIYIHICGCQNWTLFFVSRELTSLFSETGYNTGESVIRLGWMSSRLPGSLVQFTQCWYNKNTPPCLRGKHFSQWNISLTLTLIFITLHDMWTNMTCRELYFILFLPKL